MLAVLFVCFLLNVKGKESADTIQVNKLLNLAYDLEYSYPDSSFHLSQKALNISTSLNYQRGAAKAYTRMGSILFTKGQNDKSLPCFKAALRIREEQKDFNGAAKSCISIANTYIVLGKIDSAFYILYKALRFNKLSNDSLAMAGTYLALGNTNEQYGDTKKALEYYLKAEQIWERQNYTQGMELAYSGLGYHYHQQGDMAKALSYFLKAEEILCNFNSPVDRAKNLNNIATCYEQLKDYPKAKEIYFQTLAEYEKLGMKNDIALCLGNIGNYFINQNQLDSAIHYLLRSLPIAREVKDLQRVAISLKLLSKVYYLKGDFKTAFDYNTRYSNLNDSLLNNEKIASISEMETKYETEKKEQQIVLLDAQNKTKLAQRNIFIVGTLLFLLLAIAILVGLLKTRKEKKISEALLLNILPAEVAEELKQKGSADAQFFDEVTVLFTDFKDFTQITERLTPTELVNLLHSCFKAFDDIITKHRVEKIKTIGDSYMCAGGLPVPNKSNANDVVQAGLEIQDYMKTLMEQRKKEGKEPIEMRLGIHTGPVVAGIVGVKKFAYDIWGDTVNTASRMENSGAAGKVNISETTFELIKDQFICTPRGKIEAKHKGLIEMYFVEGRIKN